MAGRCDHNTIKAASSRVQDARQFPFPGKDTRVVARCDETFIVHAAVTLSKANVFRALTDLSVKFLISLEYDENDS